MRFHGLLLLSIIFFTTGCYAAGAFDNFETGTAASEWGFYNGPEFPGAKGEAVISKDAAHSGKSGLALSFDFTAGGNYVQTGRSIPAGIKANSIRLWVRKPCPNTIGFRVSDSEGQTFQKTFDIPHGGWQEILISFSGWTGYWGGKNDGVFRGSPSNLALLVQNDGAQKGKVYFDDMRFIESGISEGMSDITYTASEFEPAQGWDFVSWEKAGGSGYRDKTLRYDFTAGAEEIGTGTDLALMGSPLSLKLKVSSRSSGAKLMMRIGSHFQTFEKIIGDLDGTGEQTFDVPLGDMSSWKYYGGENSGSVIWPLRVTFIGTVPGDGAKTGEVSFINMQVKSQIPDRSSIVLVPSGRMENGKARFTCNITNLFSARSQGTLTSIARDFSGTILEKKSRPVTIEKGDTIQQEVVIDPGNRPFVECEFSYKSGARIYGPSVTSAVSTLADKGSSALDPDSAFGMGVYLCRYPDNPEGYRMMTKAAEMAMAAGVKWSREEFGWRGIEQERGKFNWSSYDKVVDTAISHGISVYGLIDYWSDWTKPYTQEGINDYVNYCRALVTRYKDRIKYWEIWNEPNIFFWPGPKEVYPELLKAAYKAIKEIDPEAQVLGCSTAGIDPAFIQMVMDARAPFDVLTIHPYRAVLDDERFIQELKDVYNLTAKADGKKKPVWITEMGWATDIPYGISERMQASLLARTYLCAAASQAAGNVSWYDFREDGSNPFYNEHHLGVVRSDDFAPKPGYRALASICNTLSGQKFNRKLDIGTGILAFKFTGGGKESIALWARDRNAILRLKVKGSSVVMRNLMGEDTPIKASGESVVISAQSDIPVLLTGKTVDITPVSKPIYIFSDKAVHAGSDVVIRLQSETPVSGLDTGLDAPEGWTISRGAKGSFTVRVSPNEQPGDKQFILKLRQGRDTYNVPLQITVVPKLIEF